MSPSDAPQGDLPRRSSRRTLTLAWPLAAVAAVALASAGALAGGLLRGSPKDPCTQLEAVGLSCASTQTVTTTVNATLTPPPVTVVAEPTSPKSSPADVVPPVSTPPDETSAPPTAGDPFPLLGQATSSEVVDSFVQSFGCEIPAPVFQPGDGYECRSAGISFAVDMALDVSAITLYAGGELGFSRYPGSLPYGLTWGAPRAATQADLDGRLGQPVQQYVPDSADSVVPYRDGYRLGGGAYQGFFVEYTIATQGLSQVSASVDPPVCIDGSC